MQDWRMRVVIAAVVLALDVGAASAGEITGTIQAVDTQEKVYVLADGTTLWPQPGHHVVVLAPGTKVKVKYEERDGKKIVISFENPD